MHIVSFDGQGKIAQIRQSWDQGALLKQVDVIGRSGRNWPIRDGSDQIKVITTCLSARGAVAESAPESSDVLHRSRGNSVNALRDPHASLELFAPRDAAEDAAAARIISPYAGTRPRQRSFTEILGDEPTDEDDGSPSRGRSQSPSKFIAPKAGSNKKFQPNRLFETDEQDEDDGRGRVQQQTRPIAPKIGAGKNFQPSRLFEMEEEAHDEDNGRGRSQHQTRPIAPKVGAGKNFQPSRLFEVEDEQDSPDNKPKPDRFYRPNPKRFQHFALGDEHGEGEETTPKASDQTDRSRSRSKHDSSWSFDDFVTPQKALPTRTIRRPQDVRHWDNEAEETPANQRKPAGKPRRDAEHHFDFADDGPEPTEPRPAGVPRGTKHNTGLGLYDNHVYNEDGKAPSPGPDPYALGNITNLKDRKKTFDPSFSMTDDPEDDQTPQPRKVSEDRKKAVKMMEANWAATDDSPASQKENSRGSAAAPGRRLGNQGISIAGDGMGSRKGANADRASNKGILIGGDGMGGKKGTARDWLFPEED